MTKKLRNRKTRVLAGLALACAGALLAGCGGSGGGSSSADNGAGADKGKKVTISYGVWDPVQEPTMKKIIAAFEAKNPNIKIDFQLTPNKQYWTKLKTSATSGTAPDVFWMNGPNLPFYAGNGVLEPLDSLVEGGQIKTSDYSKSLVDLYTYDGKLFGMPKDFDTVGLWYNKKLFDEAGVAYPDDTWTWEKTQEAAKKLTNKSKGIYGMYAYFASQETYYDLIAQAGGYVISPDKKKSGYDSPESQAAFQYWMDFIKDGSSPSFAEMNDIDPDSAGVMLKQGKVAMMPAASYNVNDFLDSPAGKDLDVAVYPKGKKAATIVHGLANVVSAKSKNKDAAKTFVAFLGSKEAADIQAQSGSVLPAFNGTQETWVQTHPEMHLQVFVDMLDIAVPYPSSKNTSAWTSEEKNYLAKIWSGDYTVAEGTKKMADVMNQALAKE